MLVARKASGRVAKCIFDQIEANLAEIQPKNHQNVQKTHFLQKPPGRSQWVKQRSMPFAPEKTPHISLVCKLVSKTGNANLQCDLLTMTTEQKDQKKNLKELSTNLHCFILRFFIQFSTGTRFLNTERAYKGSAVCTLFASFAPIIGTLRYHDGTSQDGCRK